MKLGPPEYKENHSDTLLKRDLQFDEVAPHPESFQSASNLRNVESKLQILKNKSVAAAPPKTAMLLKFGISILKQSQIYRIIRSGFSFRTSSHTTLAS